MRLRRLGPDEYGWSVSNEDGSLDKGDLYVIGDGHGTVVFLTSKQARELSGEPVSRVDWQRPEEERDEQEPRKPIASSRADAVRQATEAGTQRAPRADPEPEA